MSAHKEHTHIEYAQLLSEWDQRSLSPPPVQKGSVLASLKHGISCGDTVLDNLPHTALRQLMKTGLIDEIEELGGDVSVLYENGDEIPSWADRERVERGQAVYMRLFYSFQTSLLAALLHGFVVARFSDVLVDSGYASCSKQTFTRFMHTSYAIYSWMNSSLFDSRSNARQNVLRVRTMHSLARRRSATKFREANAGVPLSQFDLALVQLAFSGISVDIVVREMGITLSDEECDDYVHLWAYLGHLLGIKREFNVALLTKKCTTVRSEFFSLVPAMSKNAPESGRRLLHLLFKGLEEHSVMPRKYFVLLYFAPRRDFLKADQWSQLAPPSEQDCEYMRTHWRTLASSSVARVCVNTMLRVITTCQVDYPRVWGVMRGVLKTVRDCSEYMYSNWYDTST